MAEVGILGHHINTSHGFLSSVSHAIKTEATIFQIFLSNPKQYKGYRQTTNKLNEFKQLLLEAKIKVVVHGNLMLNFCQPKGSLIYNKSCESLIKDLIDSVLINALGVVIHMGHNTKALHLTTDQAINNYVTGVMHCLDKSPSSSIIIFETGAGQGNEICTSISDLGKLYNKFEKKYRKRIKFCIDTCHIYASGYNIGDPEYVDVFFNHIDIHLGIKNVLVVHLNDSKCPLYSKKDRHADIGKGKIDIKGLEEFVKQCRNKQIPMVLETPGEDHIISSDIDNDMIEKLLTKTINIENFSNYLHNHRVLRKSNTQQLTHHKQIEIIKKWLKY